MDTTIETSLCSDKQAVENGMSQSSVDTFHAEGRVKEKFCSIGIQHSSDMATIVTESTHFNGSGEDAETAATKVNCESQNETENGLQEVVADNDSLDGVMNNEAVQNNIKGGFYDAFCDSDSINEDQEQQEPKHDLKEEEAPCGPDLIALSISKEFSVTQENSTNGEESCPAVLEQQDCSEDTSKNENTEDITTESETDVETGKKEAEDGDEICDDSNEKVRVMTEVETCEEDANCEGNDEMEKANEIENTNEGKDDDFADADKDSNNTNDADKQEEQKCSEICEEDDDSLEPETSIDADGHCIDQGEKQIYENVEDGEECEKVNEDNNESQHYVDAETEDKKPNEEFRDTDEDKDKEKELLTAHSSVNPNESETLKEDDTPIESECLENRQEIHEEEISALDVTNTDEVGVKNETSQLEEFEKQERELEEKENEEIVNVQEDNDDGNTESKNTTEILHSNSVVHGEELKSQIPVTNRSIPTGSIPKKVIGKPKLSIKKPTQEAKPTTATSKNQKADTRKPAQETDKPVGNTSNVKKPAKLRSASGSKVESQSKSPSRSSATKLKSRSASEETDQPRAGEAKIIKKIKVNKQQNENSAPPPFDNSTVIVPVPLKPVKPKNKRPSGEDSPNKPEGQLTSCSSGSSELFQDQPSPLRQYIKAPSGIKPSSITKPKIVRQRTTDCVELQTITKPTPVPEAKQVEIKQNAASRARLQRLHEEAIKKLEQQDENQYQTPLQRKEAEVKEIKRQLQEAYQEIGDRETEMEALQQHCVDEIAEAIKDREETIVALQAQIEQLSDEYQNLTQIHGEVRRRMEELERTVSKMEAETKEREERHQRYYLEMYKKGQESAKFERQDELEKLAVQEPDKVSVEELLEKLELTQQDLHKWQTIKLMETYSESDRPATEADAKLKFLRDSMYHYLTDKDRDQALQHLTAIIGIFNFTDVQMNSIMKCLADRKKKGKI